MTIYQEIFRKHRRNGVLIDTNLLVLLAVGLYNPQRVQTFKRTNAYMLEDFHRIRQLAGYFSRRITTPNILTEVDNLVRQLPEREHPAIALTMQRMIDQLFEIYVPTLDASRGRGYANLGLTDCITLASSDDVLVVTVDFRLAKTLEKAGKDVVNINHLRNLN